MPVHTHIRSLDSHLFRSRTCGRQPIAGFQQVTMPSAGSGWLFHHPVSPAQLDSCQIHLPYLRGRHKRERESCQQGCSVTGASKVLTVAG